MTLRISLSRPRRAAIFEACIAASACLACFVTALFLSFSLWLTVLVGLIPLLLCLYEQRRMAALTSGYVLHAHPFEPWLLQKVEPGHGAQGTETGLSVSDQSVTKGKCVKLEHFWSHIFGVTLALKTINDPHNGSKNVRIMVWRCQLPLETYRRLCVMVNWQVNQSQKEQSLESV